MPVDEPPVTVLMADDDREDCQLTELALRQAHPDVALQFVHDGEELLDYLRHEGRFSGSEAPFPGLILLDVNMPRLDGMQALRRIKDDPQLRRVPVVMFTSSYADSDVNQSYDLGASAFITKPMDFEGYSDSFRKLSGFFLDVALLPTTA